MAAEVMMDFSKFDAEVDLEQLALESAEIKKNGGTGNYPETPSGQYRARIEKLEVGGTRDGRPMLKAQFRIIDSAEDADTDAIEFIDRIKQRGNKMPCLFMNRVLYGTKNDANMIASAVGWLETLEPSEDVCPDGVEFKSYKKFADLVLDIAEDVSELEYDVDYDPEAFNSISILDVYE